MEGTHDKHNKIPYFFGTTEPNQMGFLPRCRYLVTLLLSQSIIRLIHNFESYWCWKSDCNFLRGQSVVLTSKAYWLNFYSDDSFYRFLSSMFSFLWKAIFIIHDWSPFHVSLVDSKIDNAVKYSVLCNDLSAQALFKIQRLIWNWRCRKTLSVIWWIIDGVCLSLEWSADYTFRALDRKLWHCKDHMKYLTVSNCMGFCSRPSPFFLYLSIPCNFCPSCEFI